MINSPTFLHKKESLTGLWAKNTVNLDEMALNYVLEKRVQTSFTSNLAETRNSKIYVWWIYNIRPIDIFCPNQ